jgi:ammonia channel protein AmtB
MLRVALRRHTVAISSLQDLGVHLCLPGVSMRLQVSVAVTLAASAGCLGVFSLQQLLGAGLNLRAALDGALAGLVAISASKVCSCAFDCSVLWQLL